MDTAVQNGSNIAATGTSMNTKGAIREAGMNTHITHRNHTRQAARGLVLLAALGFAAGASAQAVRINFRPLTPQEIKDFGLTNTTQTANGVGNVGVGTPVYLEALVTNGAVVVTSTWTLVSAPVASTAAFLPSPLAATNPTYDVGYRLGFTVADRQMIVPNVVGDYQIEVAVVEPGKTNKATAMVYGATFLGVDFVSGGVKLCKACHEADRPLIFSNFNMTAHAGAFTRAITGESTDHFQSFCIKCHVVGYDTNPAATNGGFDDVAAQVGWTFPGGVSPTNWTAMHSNLQNKSNIQCENCHGPAYEHATALGDPAQIGGSLSAGNCGVCHDSLTHHVKNYEWEQSGHGGGADVSFATRTGCWECHTTRYFLDAFDPEYAGAVTPRGTGYEGITCAACHDPHVMGAGEHQIRELGQVALSNEFVITEADAGDGLICIRCHHSRRRAEWYAVSNSLSSTFGPHHSVQADMLAGQNAVEYGMDMPSSKHLDVVEHACVGCHMQELEGTAFSNAYTKAGGHTFKMVWDAGTTNTDDDVAITESCQTCHGEIDEFNFGGEDYDRDGIVEGVQHEIHGLLEEVALLLPPVGSPSVTVASCTGIVYRKAVYNYLFVEGDGSHGVHNPKYAAALLQASLDDLRGGIDVDKDGLVDSYEIEKFGDLTSQSGNSDADLDGVNNKMEQAAGTNPNLADTDSDGFSDLAELQMGTDPKNPGSKPDAGLIAMLPAYELAYQHSTNGVPMQFQSIPMMGDSGWQNLGPTMMSSNSPSYQLISPRDTTQNYFRVVTP
jgi:hypothetical protein